MSIYEASIATNNSAESYYSKLKSLIKTCHPRIWTFISNINNIIQDTENDIGRLNLGKKISRPRNSKDINNDEKRRICKEKLTDGHYTPSEFFKRSVTLLET